MWILLELEKEPSESVPQTLSLKATKNKNLIMKFGSHCFDTRRICLVPKIRLSSPFL